MKIKPLRDIIVAIPCEETGRVGLLYMPDNTKQALRTHRKMLVIAAGPLANEQGIEPGVIVHASDVWGDPMDYGTKRCWIGRSRDINGIVQGERIEDTGKYLD